jgi:hypothetical protein
MEVWFLEEQVVYLFEPGKTSTLSLMGYKRWFVAGKGTRNNMESFETNCLINKEGYKGLWTRCTRPSGN